MLDENTTVSFIQNLLDIRSDGASLAIKKPINDMIQCQIQSVKDRITEKLDVGDRQMAFFDFVN